MMSSYRSTVYGSYADSASYSTVYTSTTDDKGPAEVDGTAANRVKSGADTAPAEKDGTATCHMITEGPKGACQAGPTEGGRSKLERHFPTRATQ